MISKDKADKLIRIYFFICDKFEELKYYSWRFSNINQPKLTDQEIMTIYLFVMDQQRYFKIKDIHLFTTECLTRWLTAFCNYKTFDNRLNKLTGAFNGLVEIIMTNFRPEDCCLRQSLLDSMPIITCSGKRTR